MTTPPHQQLPPFGTPPPHPQAYPPPAPGSGRTVDLVLSWILYVGQVLGAATMVLVSIFAAFIDAYCHDGSGSCANDNTGGALIGYWIALGVLLVAALVSMIVATSTQRAVWPWAVGGFGLSVVATVAFFAVLAA